MIVVRIAAADFARLPAAARDALEDYGGGRRLCYRTPDGTIREDYAFRLPAAVWEDVRRLAAATPPPI